MSSDTVRGEAQSEAQVSPEKKVLSSPMRRWLGGAMQVVGGLGMALTGLAILSLPFVAFVGGRAAASNLRSSAESVGAVAASADEFRSALVKGDEALRSASQSLETVSSSLTGSDLVLASVEELLGEELPLTLEKTQTSLVAAEAGAAAMDGVLRGLSLLGLDYDPQQPLDESLAETAASLEPLPSSLEKTASDLGKTRTDLDSVAEDLDRLGKDLESLAEELDTTAEGLEDRGDELNSLARRLGAWANWAGAAAWLGALVAGLLLIWSLLVNLVLLTVGAGLREGWLPPQAKLD